MPPTATSRAANNIHWQAAMRGAHASNDSPTNLSLSSPSRWRATAPGSRPSMEALPSCCGKRSALSSFPRSCGGFTNNQHEGKHVIMDGAIRLIVDQEMDGSLGEILDRLADGRERRPDDFRHWCIVEPCNGNRPWDFQAGPVQSQHDAGSHVVVCASHSGHFGAVTEKLIGRFDAGPEGKVATGRPGLPVDPCFAQRI